jgi:subtilisin family serine protease
LRVAARFARQGSSNPPLVAIDAVTRGDPQQLRAALEALGLQRGSVYANDVGGWLPVSRIDAAAALAEVHSLRAALSRSRAVAVTSQGDFAQGSTALRTTYPTLSGAGVTVGVLSDSFNCYGVYDKPGSGVPASGAQGYAPNGFANDDATFDESNGYLPASVRVLEEATCTQYGQPLQLPFADEGRAMLQIVHDVAPGAALAFHTGTNSEADFANGIIALANAGATVIADDVGYFDEPFFQDGIVAQAIDTVAAQGVVYFSAAGNNGQLSYENTAPSFNTPGSGVNAGEMLLNFDPTGATTAAALQVDIPALVPGEFLGLIVEWDQPYLTGAPGSPGSTSSIDLCVSGASGYTVVNLDGAPMTCTGPNTTGTDTNQPNNGDAEQVLILGNPANTAGNSAATTISLIIGLANGTPPGRIKVVVADDGAGSVIKAFATNSPTLQGHPGAKGAAAVAAAFFPQTPRCGVTPAVLEPFSSEGGEPILFDTTGARLATPEMRQKPDFTGPDGVNNSFFGFFIAKYSIPDNSSVAGCLDNTSYLNFFGTSSATPHAAGAAALMLQANPAVTAVQILQNLRTSAMAMGGNTPNYDSGYGFLQVDAALARLPAGPPILELASSTVTAGTSTTLSWLAVNATSCSASGSWSGAQSPSGTLTVTPTSAGTDTYTLTCTTAAGMQASSAVLTVQDPPPPPSKGGGGTLEILSLLALCGALGRRLSRAAHRVG